MKQLNLKSMMVALGVLLSLNAHAYVAFDACVDGIYYDLDTSAKTASVRSGYNKYTGSVYIPSSFNYNGSNYSVTSIGISAFYGCSGLTSITIPNSVTSIGERAFHGCSSLTSITIPNSVTYIGNEAFYVCSGLTSLTIPNSVTSIGSFAFYFCSSLTSLTIPNSVTSIGSYAFGCCSSLTSITVESGNAYYDSRNDCNAIIKKSSNTLIVGCQKTTIPSSVTSIGDDAFDGCSNLTSITIPNSVTSIGNAAFGGCSGLTSITIPNSVTSIGDNAFTWCSGLTSITIPNSVTSIGNGAFNGCSGLTSLTIPNSVTSIGSYAFSNCSGLTSITIPNSVTSIGDNAFYYCSDLTSITIPNSVTSIGSSAFYFCSSLTSLTIPNSVTSIGSSAFYFCSSLTSLTIPNSVTSIGNGAFNGCSGLTSITVESGNAYYDSRNDCNAIIEKSSNTLIVGCQKTTIPNSVTSIGDNAFNGCSSLTSITIPNSVRSIGNEAFGKCYGLTSVISEIKEPFAFGSSGFSDICFFCVLTVPYGTKDAYIAAGWTEDVFQGGIVESSSQMEQSLSLTSLPSMTYGASNYTLPAKTTQGLTLTWTSSNINVATISGNTLTVKGAGTATITASQAGNEEYKPFSKTFTLTVSKATLTVTANNYTIQQGSALPTYGVTFSGFKNGDTKSVLTKQPTITCSATTASAPGTYSIKASGATAANYNFSYVNGTLTITEKPSQSMSLVSLPSMTYGAANYTLPTQTTQGLTLTWASSNTGVATISGNTLTVKGAGTAAITASQAGNEEYKPFSKEFTLTVAKAPLTITAQDFTRYEGEENPAFTVSYEGFVKNEDATVLTAQPVIATTATAESAAGTYPITVSGATAANYEITFVAGTLTVQAKTVQTIALTSLPDMTYGGDTYTLPAQTEEGFDLTWASSNTAVATISGNTLTVKGAGTAAITASQVGNEEYKPFSKEFALTVAKAPLTITANDATKNVGDVNPAFTASYEGFVGDDDASVLTAQPTFTTEADENSPVGTYAIVVSGAEAANYEINYVNGTLTVVDEWSKNNTLAITDTQVLRGRQIVLPVSMSNTENITALQFDLTLPAGVSIAKNAKGKYIVAKTERCADHTLSASKPGEANVYKVLLYSTEVESITGNEGAVIDVPLEAAEDMEAGDYEVRLSNINLTTTAEKKITPADVTCVLTVRNSIPGDANGDGTIDVTDIVGIANSILGRASESFDAVAADVNGDGSVDVTDIVVTANIILHDGGANAANVRGAMQMLDPQ